MATTTWYANKDARIARRSSDGLSQGAGASSYIPVGYYSGYLYRSLIGFNYSFSGMVTITSAILTLKTSGQYYVAFGSDPDIYVRRLTSSWTEGTSVALSTTNAVEWSNQPSATTSNQATKDVTTSENATVTIDITALVNDAKAAGVFYGVQLIAVTDNGSTGASDDITEFYTRETSYDPYITVTYTTNQPPTSPTSMTPTGGSLVVNDTSPQLQFTHNDPDGDSPVRFDVEVYNTTGNNASIGSLAWSTYDNTSDLVNPITVSTGTLTAGNWYAWRARTADAASGDGAWSGYNYFRLHPALTLGFDQPTGNSQYGRMFYTAATNTTPGFYPGWSFSCSLGGSQTGGTFLVRNSSDTTTLNGGGSGESIGTASSLKSSYRPPNSTTTTYILRLQSVTCSHGQVAGTVSRTGIKARWGRYAARQQTTGATTFADAAITSSNGHGSITWEWGASGDGTEPVGSAWASSIAGVTPADYQHYRATLLAWGSATPTSPSIDSITLKWSTLVPTPYFWTLSAGAVVESGQFLFGTQCLKVSNNGATNQHAYYDLDGLQQNTDYVLSGYVKTTGGNANPAIRLFPYATSSGGLVSSTGTEGTEPFGGAYILPPNSNANASGPITQATDGWERIWVKWNSGTRTQVRVYIGTLGSGGTNGAVARFDALKLEASKTINPWSPGFVGEAITLDAGGLQVDASKGGIFRVKTSGGATLLPNSAGLDVQADQTDQYSAIRFTDQGAARVILDYGTGSTDDFRLLTATGSAGAESTTTRLQMDVANADLEVGSSTRLLITNTSDLTTSSTNHAFQIGPDTGANIRADSNEIVALNNGAVADLNVQTDGGRLQINNNSAPTTSSHGLLIGGDFALYRTAASAATLGSDDRLQHPTHGWKVTKTSTQSVANNTYTKITGWATSDWNGAVGASWNGTNNAIYVTDPGVYMIYIWVKMASTTVIWRNIIAPIISTSTPDPSTHWDGDLEEWHYKAVTNAQQLKHGATWLVDGIAANTYIAAGIYQGSGAALNVEGAKLAVVYLGSSA